MDKNKYACHNLKKKNIQRKCNENQVEELFYILCSFLFTEICFCGVTLNKAAEDT